MGQTEGRCCCGVKSDGKVQVIHAALPGSEKVLEGATASPAIAPVVAHAQNEQRHEAPAQQERQQQSKQTEAENADAKSEGGQSGTSQASGFSGQEEMSKEQRVEAKKLIKNFVRSMVKGQPMDVVLASGKMKTCFVCLSRQLDALKIKANEKDKQERRIPLASIEELFAGSDASADQGPMLDDLAVTISLISRECITFRMADIEARDTLVMCLTMFANEAKAQAEA